MSGIWIQWAAKILTLAAGLAGVGSIFNAVRLNKEKHHEDDPNARQEVRPAPAPAPAAKP